MRMMRTMRSGTGRARLVLMPCHQLAVKVCPKALLPRRVLAAVMVCVCVGGGPLLLSDCCAGGALYVGPPRIRLRQLLLAPAVKCHPTQLHLPLPCR